MDYKEIIKIEKLVFGGQALAHTKDGKTAFVWNALPGEVVEARLLKKRKSCWEMSAEKIIEPSVFRVPAQENHYLSCSPWQIISPAQELEEKKNLAREVYKKIGGFDWRGEIVSLESLYGYRNKMEYSFALDEVGEVALALYDRGSKYPAPHGLCVLAREDLNNSALKILGWIKQNNIPKRSLKSLIIRSNGAGQTLAALFIKDRLDFPEKPLLGPDLLGFSLIYSTHKSPASVVSEVLYSSGQNFLEVQLLKTKLRFGLFSFFQINLALFSSALEDIGDFLEQDDLLDYYCGVGAISLCLREKIKSAHLVEENPEAAAFAALNIEINQAENFSVSALRAEESLTQINENKTLLLDPPRAGLDPKLINRIKEVLPPKIIYLSCDLATQARDLSALLPYYEIIFSRLYNFFPRTPHIEGLVILKRK